MRVFKLCLAGLVFLVLWACSESARSIGDSGAITGPDAAARESTCDVKDGEAATRRLFKQPLQGIFSDLWTDIEDGCSNDVAEEDDIFALLDSLSAVVERLGGLTDSNDQALAATAANVALALHPSPPTNTVQPAAFGPGGATGVRAGASVEEVRSRSAVTLDLTVERGSVETSADWIVGAFPRSTWGQVFGGVTAFVWGYPASDGAHYDWNTAPEFSVFAGDNQVDVVFCAEHPIELGPLGSDGGQPRVYKEEGDTATVLQPSGEQSLDALCDDWWGITPEGGGLLGLARALFLPQPLFAFQSIDDGGDDDAVLRLEIRGVGGGTIDFSPFEPWSVDPEGYLTWKSVNALGDSIAAAPIFEDLLIASTVDENGNVVELNALLADSLVVTAFTGGGEPIEFVDITLVVENNNGEPAGALLVGDATEVTGEPGGIALFGAGTVGTPAKPGGYRLCAEGDFGGFSFTRVCTTAPFNVKNDTGN